MKELTIRLDHLAIGYKSRRNTTLITENINTGLYSHELTCLLGPNGAGKSTLLKTLSGFIEPLGGEINICGQPIGSYSPRQLACIIGVVLTERMDIRDMTVRHLVEMGRSPYTGFWGHISEKDKDIVEESIERVGIKHLADRMIDTLSDGERQKTMIAKALAQKTDIIFLDEPTAFLDYPSKVELMQLLLSLAHQEGKTVFMSTHDLELALQISDKIWLLDRENGLHTGTPEDLSLDGSMERYFRREGVEFDAETGLFKVKSGVKMSVGFNGAGRRAAMLRKALRRNGFNPVDDISIEPLIEVGNEYFLLGGKKYDNIDSLISDLLNFI